MAGGYDGEIKLNTTIETQKATSQIMQLENKMVKIADKIADIKKGMDALKDAKVPTEEYAEIQSHLERCTVQFDKLLAKQLEMQNLGKTSGSAWDSLQYKMQELGNAIEADKIDMQNLVEEGNAFKSVSETEEYEKLSRELKNAENEMSALVRRHEELAQKQNKIANNNAYKNVSQESRRAENNVKKYSKAVKNTDKSHKKATRSGYSFGRMLKQMLFSFVFFQVLSKIISAVSDAFKTGINNLAKYSSTFNKTMSELSSANATLKNSLATAFLPIMNVAIPALTALINKLISACNAVNQFIAVISGKGTWTRATKQQIDYAKSLDKTAGSADNAKSALAGFDDLDVLQNDSGSGGGGEVEDPSTMFEELPVDNEVIEWIDNIENRMKPLLNTIGDMKKAFLDGFSDTWNKLNVSDHIANIIDNLKGIGNCLNEIFTDEDVQSAAKRFIERFSYYIGRDIASFISIGVSIVDFITGSIENALEENKDGIKEWIISMFDITGDIEEIKSLLFEAIANIFTVLDTEEAQVLGGHIVSMFMNAFMFASETIGKLVRDALLIVSSAIIDNQEDIKTALNGLISIFGHAFGAISQTMSSTFSNFSKMYDEHLKPLFDGIASGLSDIVATALSVFNESLLPVIEEMGAVFSDFMVNVLEPLFSEAITFVGNIAEILNLLWQNIIAPFLEWLISTFGPAIGVIFTSVSGAILNIYTIIATKVKLVLTILNNLLQFIITGFTVGWKQAFSDLANNFQMVWDGMCETVKSAVNVIIGIVNSMIGAIETAINSIIDGINKMIKAAVSMASKVGIHISFDEIDHVQFGRVPELANGGITTGDTLARIGEAGKEAVLPLEKNTDWMDTLADKINSGREINIRFTGTLAQLARVLKPALDDEDNRIGVVLG